MRKVISMIAVAALCICALGATARQTETDAAEKAAVCWVALNRVDDSTKGRPKRVSAGVKQVILSHIEEYSKKPAEARERIVLLMGDLPRVELFARQVTPGWDVWGNEVESTMEWR